MIRQFRPADAEPCSRLIHFCLADDSSIPSALRERFIGLETPQAMEERARLFYVAVYEADDQILGVAGLDMNEIRLLCVSPEHQRQGIGRSLFQHLLGMVPGILFPDIFVYSSMQGKEFYSACGFAEKGAVRFDIDGEKLDTIFMAFPLG